MPFPGASDFISAATASATRASASVLPQERTVSTCGASSAKASPQKYSAGAKSVRASSTETSSVPANSVSPETASTTRTPFPCAASGAAGTTGVPVPKPRAIAQASAPSASSARGGVCAYFRGIDEAASRVARKSSPNGRNDGSRRRSSLGEISAPKFQRVGRKSGSESLKNAASA